MMIVNFIPQNRQSISTVTLNDVVRLLPAQLPWKVNLWVGDRLARYGKTTEGIVFLVELDHEPSVEMRQYFEKLMKPLGVQATVYEDWKNQKWSAVRLYDKGQLLINKRTMAYKRLPTPVQSSIVLTADELKAKLPETIPYEGKVYLTGGVVKNGWTANDVDFICFDEKEHTHLLKLSRFLTNAIGWKVDVGNKVMPEREPVYCCLAYEGRKCQL